MFLCPSDADKLLARRVFASTMYNLLALHTRTDLVLDILCDSPCISALQETVPWVASPGPSCTELCTAALSHACTSEARDNKLLSSGGEM